MEVTMNGESDSQEDKLQCTRCNYSALSKRQLQRHTKQKHSPNKLTCEQCGEKFSRALMFKLHQATHNATNEHACSTCGKTFPLVSLLKIHQETHSTESIHPCPHCSKQFRQKSALSKHVAFGHNKKNIHACTTCGQVFPSPSTLILHMDAHKNEKVTPSNKVSKVQQDGSSRASINLRTYSPYRRHIEHNMFKCQRCQKKFFTSSALARHMRIHANVHTHVCPECKIEFTSKKALQKHSSAHIYECDRCGRKYRQKTQLDYHLQNDCKGKLLICNICGRIFGKSSSLRRHLEIHRETNKFQCPECCKNYKTQADLQTHQWLHQGDGYKCDDCGKAFGTKQHLIWHSYLHMSKFPVSGSDSEVKKETDNSESNAEKDDSCEVEVVLKPPQAVPSKIKKEKSESPDPGTSKESKGKSSTSRTPKKESRGTVPKTIKVEPKTPAKKVSSKSQKTLKKKPNTRGNDGKKSTPEVQEKKSTTEIVKEKSGDSSGKKTRLGLPSTKTSKALLKKKNRGKKSTKSTPASSQNDVENKETVAPTPVEGEPEERTQTIKEVEELIAQGVAASVKRESIDVKDIPSAEVMFDDIDENVELDIREAIATLTEMGSHNEIGPEDLIDTFASVDQENTGDKDSVPLTPTGENGACDTLGVVEQALQTDPMTKEPHEDLEALYAMDTDNETETERDNELRDEESAQLLSELTGDCMGEPTLESCSEMQTQTEMETQTDLETLAENINSTDIADELVSHINMEVVDAIHQSTKEIENLCKAGTSDESNVLVNDAISAEGIVNELSVSTKDQNELIDESASQTIGDSSAVDVSQTENFELVNLESSAVINEAGTVLDSGAPKELYSSPKDVCSNDTKAPTQEQASVAAPNTESCDNGSEVIHPENELTTDQQLASDRQPDLPPDSETALSKESITENETSKLQTTERTQRDETQVKTESNNFNESSVECGAENLELHCQHDCEKCSSDFGIGIKRTNCPHNKELKVVIEKLDYKDCPVVDPPATTTKTVEPAPASRTRRSVSSELSVNVSDPAKIGEATEEQQSVDGLPQSSKSPVGASRLRRRVRQASGTRSVSTKSCDTRRRESLSSNSDTGSKATDLSGMTTRSANQRVTRYTRSGVPLSEVRESRKTIPGSDRKHARKILPPSVKKKVESEKSPPPRYKVSTVTDLTIRITTQDSTGNSQQAKKSLSPRHENSANPKAPQKPTYTVSTSPSQDPNQLSKLYISKSPPQKSGNGDGKIVVPSPRSTADEALRRNFGASQELCVVIDDINELILLQQERLRKLKHLKPVKLAKDLESVHPSRKRKNRSEESMHLSDPVSRPTKVFLKLPKDRVKKHEQRLSYIDKQFSDMSELEKMAQIAKERKKILNSPGVEEPHEYQQPDSSQDTHKNKNVIRIPKVSARKGVELGTISFRTIGKNSTTPTTESASKIFGASEKSSLSSDTSKKTYKQASGPCPSATRSVLSVEECDSTSMAESIRHASSSARGGQNASVNKRERKSNPERAKSSSSDDHSSDDVVYEPLDLSIRIHQFAPAEVKPDPDGEREDYAESTDMDTVEGFCSCPDKPSQQRQSLQSSSVLPVSVKLEPESGTSEANKQCSNDEYCSSDAQAGYVKGDLANGATGVQQGGNENEVYGETGEVANGEDGAGAAAEFIEVIDRATQCELGDEVLYCPETADGNQGNMT